ncbi:MAG: hypothetical protein IKO72_09500 [Kiritimatiellae bacterium]|nr:hypothetical protein [Kiritimatiellia bacterium]
MNRLLLILILFSAVLAGWWFLSSSEESRVKETFKALSAAIEKNGVEPPLKGIGKARSIARLVEPGCTVEAFGRTVAFARDVREMQHQITAFRTMSAHLHVSFEDLSVNISGSATAEVICDFFYSGDDFGWSVRDARQLEATLHKDPDSGRWKFARARLTNIIEK